MILTNFDMQRERTRRGKDGGKPEWLGTTRKNTRLALGVLKYRGSAGRIMCQWMKGRMGISDWSATGLIVPPGPALWYGDRAYRPVKQWMWFAYDLCNFLLIFLSSSVVILFLTRSSMQSVFAAFSHFSLAFERLSSTLCESPVLTFSIQFRCCFNFFLKHILCCVSSAWTPISRDTFFCASFHFQ